jgi:hypothetical protein
MKPPTPRNFTFRPGAAGGGVSPVEEGEGAAGPGTDCSDDDGASDSGVSFAEGGAGVSPLLPHARIKREERAMSPSFKHHLRKIGE